MAHRENEKLISNLRDHTQLTNTVVAKCVVNDISKI